MVAPINRSFSQPIIPVPFPTQNYNDLILSCFLPFLLPLQPTDAASQLHVLGHDGNPLGVNTAQVRVLEKSNEVALRRLLQRE